MEKVRSVGAWRVLVLAGLALLVGLVAASTPARAMDARSGNTVVIGPDEVIDDDLYVSANEVVVDGTINGDLIAIGNRIEVNGAVKQDVMAAGQSVKIGGTVGHTARIAGQTLLLSKDARVAGDLMAAGSSLQNEPSSTVGGTLAYAGSQALLEGTVNEDLKGLVNDLELSGDVGRNVDVRVGGDDPGLTLTDTARVGGDLDYESSSEAQISPDAQIGGQVLRTERPSQEEPTRTALNVVLDILRSLIALVLVGLLLMWVAPHWTRRLSDTIHVRPLPSLGWGIVGFIVFLALTIAILLATILLAVGFGLLTLGSLVLLIISLGVLAEAVLVLAFLISMGYLAQILVSLLVGRLLLERILPARAGGRVLPLVVGLILYVILKAIPVLGFIVGLVVVVLGVGALSSWIWARFRRAPAQPPPTP